MHVLRTHSHAHCSMKHMTEVNGKEVQVVERFGKKARVRLVETSDDLIVATKHVFWAGACMRVMQMRVRDINECKFAARLHSRALVFRMRGSKCAYAEYLTCGRALACIC